MAEQLTVSDLLAAQTERKLTKMRDGIISEMDRLRTELRFVDDALSKKRKPREAAPVDRPAESRKEQPKPRRVSQSGQFEGLPRDELLRYVKEYGQPVSAPEMREYLTTKGIVRKTEAVRIALARLVRDGRLTRIETGKFAVPSTNGNGASPKAERPASSGELPGFEAAGLTDPADSSG